MNLRSRLTLKLVGFALASVVAAGFYSGEVQRNSLERGLNEQVKPIVQAAVNAVDLDAYVTILEAKDENSPAYLSAVAALREVRQRYGLRDLSVRSLDDDRQVRMVIDTGEGLTRLGIWKAFGPPTTKEEHSALNGSGAVEALTIDHSRMVKRAFAPLQRDGQVLGFVVCTLDAEHIRTEMGLIRNQILQYGFFLFLLGIVYAFLVSSNLVNPLIALAAYAERLLAGDLTKKIELRQEGEFGLVAKALDRLQSDLRQILTQIGEASGDLAMQAEGARQYALGLRQAAEQTSSIIAEINKGARQSATAALESAEELGAAYNVLGSLDRQVAEMQNAVLGVRGLAAQGAEVVEDAADHVKTAEENAGHTAEEAVLFAERTQAIGEMVSAIENIATQTATLALNATIEAARAGEYGRGFAVVARRIQRLAVSAKETVVRIREVLTEAADTAKTGGDAAEEVRGAIATASVSLASAAQTFSAVTSKLDSLTTGLTDVVIARSELAKNTGRAGEAMQGVQEIASGVSEGLARADANAAALDVAANHLTLVAGTLDRTTEALATDVTRYKT